jgi:thiosulfate reductase cytochrome b subunit
MQGTRAASSAPHVQKLHPLPIRVMHWINAVTMIVMIGSGWKIYNDEPLAKRLVLSELGALLGALLGPAGRP